jgi:hypothetical protein
MAVVVVLAVVGKNVNRAVMYTHGMLAWVNMLLAGSAVLAVHFLTMESMQQTIHVYLVPIAWQLGGAWCSVHQAAHRSLHLRGMLEHE